MNPEIERIYMDLLVRMGRAGLSKKMYLVYSVKWGQGRFIPIPEDDYRADLIGFDGYELVGTYVGKTDLPYFSQVYEDIHAFIQETTEKEYGCRPELQRLAQAG